MHNTIKLTAALFLAGVTALPAQAERFGSLGLSYSNHAGESLDDDLRETSHGVTLDYSIGWTLAEKHRVIVDALYRTDTYSSEMAEGDPYGDQAQIGLHYQYVLSDRLSLGLFGGHGRADHDDPREDYIVNFIGVEGIYDAGNDVTFFAQLGSVDSPNSESQSSSGYDSGQIYRLGIAYTGIERTSILFDLEFGQSKEYEDDDEPGDFLVVGLSGETLLKSNPNWSINYGVRFGNYDAKNDPDDIKETTFTIGARYNFGRARGNVDRVENGLIGLPYTPLRASAWTPALD